MTRFDNLPRWIAWAVLGLALVLTVLAALPAQRAAYAPVVIPKGAFTDGDLYHATTARVQAGENYYVAAAAEQRKHGYPTKPAVTFREPFEAWMLAALRTNIARWGLLLALTLATTVALREALDQVPISGRGRLLSVALMATGLANAGMAGAPYTHEVWASLLIALSLALYKSQRWWPSVLLGFAACLFREIAIPYLGVMFLFAGFQRRWRETVAWAGAGALVIVIVAVHLMFASRQYHHGDLVTAGWFKMGGWRFILTTARRNLLLAYAPAPLVAAATALCLIGLAGVKDAWSTRLAATVFIFTAMFAMVGRPDNYCWGILDAPLLPYGLARVWPSLRALIARARGLPAPVMPEPVPVAKAASAKPEA